MDVELNKIFLGEVAAVHNYGAFIRIPGGGRMQGLVHKSQISSSLVDDAAEVLTRDEKVWCKVISISDDKKIGLSMKNVDQGTGRDLDPNGVQMSLDVQRRKEKIGKFEQKAITLEAVLNTKCSRCGVQGHLAKNCFKTPDGKSYDLLPEPEPVVKLFGSAEDQKQRVAIAGMSIVETDGKKLKRKSSSDDKKKKHKKRKKSKNTRASSSSPEREKRKKRKRKRKDSSSD